MNKTTIYSISTLIIIVLALSVVMPAIRMGSAFVSGFEAGMQAVDKGDPLELPSYVDIVFTPGTHQLLNTTDSISFSNGDTYPLVITKGSVAISSKDYPSWNMWVTLSCFFASVVLLIIMICKLVKFTVNIAKERIFIQKNATYLKQLAYCLIGISILEIINGIFSEYALAKTDLALAGYEMAADWTFPWSNLIIGLISLLISIAWSRGIAIKQEQELTI